MNEEITDHIKIREIIGLEGIEEEIVSLIKKNKEELSVSFSSKGGGGAASISNEVYGASWDTDTTGGASRHAIYTKIESLAGGHDAVTLDANVGAFLGLTGQELNLDTQVKNKVFASPATGVDAVPTFRALVADDIPALPYAPDSVTQYTDELAQDAVGSILDDGTVGDIVFTYDDAGNKISGTVEDDSHAHTGATLSGIDISADTNLAVTAPIILTDDTLSHSAANGYVHTPANGASAQLLQYASAGTSKWITLSGDASIADGGVLGVNKTRLNIRNETGSTIVSTRAVYASGFNNVPLISLSDNTDEAKHDVLGITIAPIGHEANGFIATTGQCDAETNAWNVGDSLYLSTSGALTNVVPTSGAVKLVGIVTVKENYPVGKILITERQEENILAGGINTDAIIRMGDNSGTNKASFRDYANNEVAYINSDGAVLGTKFTSNIAIGTSPYACTSTTLNTNLNADLLDGQHASEFQAAGSYEVTTNKATDFTTINNTLYPTVQAVNNAINTATIGLLDYRGSYDASSNLFPATGGSGLIGAILKGDFYICSVAGTLGTTAVTAGDLIIALDDTPGQTASNWDLISNEIGYVAENVTNKVTSISAGSTDIQYPSAKLLYDQLALKLPTSTILPSNEAGASNNFLTAYNSATGAFSKAQPTWANIDKTTSSIADIATRSHTALTDIGTLTHADIDGYLDQAVKVASTPQFLRLGIGAAADATDELYVAGTSKFYATADVYSTIASGNYAVTRTADTNPALQTFISAGGVQEANPKYVVSISGKNSWGAGGASALDLSIERSDVSTLKTIALSNRVYHTATSGSYLDTMTSTGTINLQVRRADNNAVGLRHLALQPEGGEVQVGGKLAVGSTQFNFMQVTDHLDNFDCVFLPAWTEVLTGTVNDYSGNANHLTPVGFSDDTARITTALSKTVSMDGSSQYFTIADSDSMSLAGTSFTIGGWIQVVASSGVQTILAKWDTTTGAELREYLFTVQGNESLRLQAYDESADVQAYRQTSAALSAGWHHVAVVYNSASGSGATFATGLGFYVDGVAVAGGTANNNASFVDMENLTGLPTVGAYKDAAGAGSVFYIGDLGQIFVTKTALTATQIWRDYLRTRGYYGV